MSRILFVGSDYALTKMTGKLLSRNGFDVECAMGMDKALTVVHSKQIDAVIADLEISSSDRTKFCNEIKSLSKTIKLMMITGSEEDEIPVLNSGADDWIKKPYHMKVLYARINALLR